MSHSKSIHIPGMNFVGTIGSGRPITRKASPVTKRLHVSNIPFSMDEHDLASIFGNFGPITEAQIISNKRGSKGFGFVTFENIEDAVAAKAKMDGVIINNRQIEVNDALPKNRYTIVPKPDTIYDPSMIDILAKLTLRHNVSLIPSRQPIRQSRPSPQKVSGTFLDLSGASF